MYSFNSSPSIPIAKPEYIIGINGALSLRNLFIYYVTGSKKMESNKTSIWNPIIRFFLYPAYMRAGPNLCRLLKDTRAPPTCLFLFHTVHDRVVPIDHTEYVHNHYLQQAVDGTQNLVFFDKGGDEECTHNTPMHNQRVFLAVLEKWWRSEKKRTSFIT